MVRLADGYIWCLQEGDSPFAKERMQRVLNDVKVVDVLKAIIAAEIAGLHVAPQDSLPGHPKLIWEFLQIHGFLSLEPVQVTASLSFCQSSRQHIAC